MNIITYTTKHPDGFIIKETGYFTNNNFIFHNPFGPAYTNYYKPMTGKIVEREIYYLLGLEVTKDEFYTPGFIDSFIMEHS